ncbi:MAG TPA: LamG-like jellyroll fold domain-containing protein [Candidatus Saccharimonadales bacterium]|nr:LamG-like jellyroll fold domain-containing protein [Candidatus Saccharimonadales bacterium]
MSQKTRAFTLIELLMVIAIIGILAALIIVSLAGARSKANDTKRKNNARNIDTALAQYYQENASLYPVQNTDGGVDVNTLSTILSPTYLSSTNVFIHDKTASYISSSSGSSYGQAWELENIAETAVNTGNGVYATKSANAAGVVAVPAKGGAVGFNGTSTDVTINEPGSGTNLHPAAFSVAFWVNPSSVTGSHVLVHKNASSVGWRVWLNANHVNADYQGATGGTTLTSASTTALSVGKWYYIVVTYASGSVKIYVSSTATAGTMGNPTFDNTTDTNPIVMGGIPTGSGWTAFNGSVDDFRLYNRVLTTTEVGYLYNSGYGSYGTPGEINSTTPPLLVGLRFNEGTGTTLNNYTTATSATGTITNGTWNTGNSPLGLTSIGASLTGKAFVTYGPQ